MNNAAAKSTRPGAVVTRCRMVGLLGHEVGHGIVAGEGLFDAYQSQPRPDRNPTRSAHLDPASFNAAESAYATHNAKLFRLVP